LPDTIASPFDVLVYLVPGGLVLLALIYRYAPDRISKAQGRLGLGEVVIGFMAALLLGIVTLRVSEKGLDVSQFIYHESALDGIIRRFPDLPTVASTLDARLGLRNADVGWYYQYARVIVEEKAPRSAEAAERLYSLALLCRNMLVCLPVAFVIVGSRLANNSHRRWRVVGLAAGLAMFLEYLFTKAFLAYWAAAVWKILRAYIVWQSS
jgi:hypothetical protein